MKLAGLPGQFNARWFFPWRAVRLKAAKTAVSRVCKSASLSSVSSIGYTRGRNFWGKSVVNFFFFCYKLGCRVWYANT